MEKEPGHQRDHRFSPSSLSSPLFRRFLFFLSASFISYSIISSIFLFFPTEGKGRGKRGRVREIDRSLYIYIYISREILNSLNERTNTIF